MTGVEADVKASTVFSKGLYLKHGREQDSQGVLTITDIDTGERLFEGYLRQCMHCQYTWTYKPGSGIRRGFCVNCNGFICGKPRCDTCYHKEKQVEDLEAIYLKNKRAIEAAVRQHDLRELIAGVRCPNRRERMG